MAKRPKPDKDARRDAWHKPIEPGDPRREQILEWHAADGWQSCCQRILSELGLASPENPTKPIGKSALYAAFTFWKAQAITSRMFAFRDAQEELMKQFRPGDAKLAREFGEFALLQEANERQDKDIFAVATMAQDSRQRLELETKSAHTKAEIARAKLTQKDRDFALAREKFITQSCEKIMQAARDPKVREVVESAIPQAEKIAFLRQEYFKDIDNLEVELPA